MGSAFRIRLGTTVAGLALVGAFALGAIGALRADEGIYKVGDPVAPLKALDLDEKPVSLGDLKGKIAVVNFFALR